MLPLEIIYKIARFLAQAGAACTAAMIHPSFIKGPLRTMLKTHMHIIDSYKTLATWSSLYKELTPSKRLQLPKVDVLRIVMPDTHSKGTRLAKQLLAQSCFQGLKSLEVSLAESFDNESAIVRQKAFFKRASALGVRSLSVIKGSRYWYKSFEYNSLSSIALVEPSDDAILALKDRRFDTIFLFYEWKPKSTWDLHKNYWPSRRGGDQVCDYTLKQWNRHQVGQAEASVAGSKCTKVLSGVIANDVYLVALDKGGHTQRVSSSSSSSPSVLLKMNRYLGSMCTMVLYTDPDWDKE
jgi:hypothetical protein